MDIILSISLFLTGGIMDKENDQMIILNTLIPVVRRLIRMLGQSGCQHGQRMKARHSVKIVLSALEDAKEILDEE